MAKKPPIIIVGSWSMAPLLKKGDKIYLKKISPESLAVGDVICFWQNKGLLIVHRLFCIRKSQGRKLFITRADKTGRSDLPIYSSQILGKVTAVGRHGREISLEKGATAWWGRIIVLSSHLHPAVSIFLNRLILKLFQFGETKSLLKKICYNTSLIN